MGLLVGFAGGAVGGYAGLILGDVVCWTLFVFERWRIPRGHFGAYGAKARAGEWRFLKGGLRPGMIVRGRVIWECGHLSYLDIGCGFPALVTAWGPPEVGREVEATVASFLDESRVIVLEDFKTDPGMFDDRE